MPPDLDLGPNWTIRLTAVDPTTGASVSGVTVGTATITAQQVGDTNVQLLAVQGWSLVPGPGA